jgi:DNA transformation protein and related proteins
MATSDGFVEFVLDQLRDVEDVSVRRMFGGVGIYSGENFFGIIFRDILYFKVDDANRDDYVHAGMEPFKPYSDRPTTMQYFSVPLPVLEDAAECGRWARRALAAGRNRSKQPRRTVGQKRTPSKTRR